MPSAGKFRVVMKYLFILPACLILLGSLCSCQTTQGFGEDLSTLGNRISDDARERSDGD
jgi:predicted small secreted protein